MLKCINIILRFLIFCLVFILFFVHQGSLVLLLNRRDQTTNGEWTAVTILVVVVPYICSFLSQIWRSSFSTGGRWREWPHWASLLLGTLSSIAEGYIMTILNWSLLSKIPSGFLIGVLNSGLLFSIIFNGKTTTIYRCVQIILKALFAGFIIACGVMLITTGLLRTEDSVLIFVYFITMSVVMTHKFQRYIHATKGRGTQNSALLYVFVKICCTIVVMYLLQRKSHNNDEIKSISDFFVAIKIPQGTTFWLCVLILISSFLSQIVQYFSAISIKTKLNIHLSMYISSILISLLCVLIAAKVVDVSNIWWINSLTRKISPIDISTNCIPLYAAVSAMLVIPIFLAFISGDVNSTEWQSFCVYNSVFTSQYLLSAAPHAFNPGYQGKSSKRRRKIFICTTMYQESQIEMDRLLTSIKNISVSEFLRRENVTIESHIFLDNGAEGQDIKQFGLQLLSLVKENMMVDIEHGIMLYTPYGIQLSWQLHGGFPIFIHLKDVSKVKAKKRWSQVMYMRYVLNYRSFKNQRTSGNLSKISSYASLLSVDSMASLRDKNKTAQNNLTVPDSRQSTTLSDFDTNSAETEMTQVPYVEIFVGDASSVENLSEKQETSNEIFATADSRDLYTDDMEQEADEYILATDADMTFVDSSIMDLLHVCESDVQVGAVCGRTRPKGVHIHPIVWLQMFDYAKDFWIIKSSQNIIGSVMCCPGCFSIYKLDAIRDVINDYSGPVENMEDVFTKDNGEDRWMCTLMMLKGWKLRYCSNARNTTFCPEDTAEFMKQRRRWLLSDYANAILVIRKLRELLTKNDAFSVLYTLYLLQLFLIMLLYPGSTIVMLCLGLELSTGAPLIIVTPVIVALIIGYCLILLSKYSSSTQMIITKIIIMVFGAGTTYIFVSTSYIIFKDLAIGFQSGHYEHAEGFLVMIVIGSYIYGALLYPKDIWILMTGVVFLFFIPFMNMILPLYAVCNIVDQSWGTRDNQKASVPKFLQLPKIKRKMKKKIKSQMLVDTTSLQSLSASSLSISDYNQTEFDFWEDLVSTTVGVGVSNGISNEERRNGLTRLRKKALLFFLVSNLICVIALVGFYAFLLQELGSKSTFSIVMAVTLGLSPLIQISGSTVYRIDDILTRIGRWVSV